MTNAENTNLKHKDVWTGQYKDITFEINKFTMGGYDGFPAKECWTYYLYIFIDRIPERFNPKSFILEDKDQKKRGNYDYYGHPIISSIEMHGGITYYKPHGDSCIQIGCDFQHYHDEGYLYSLPLVESEARASIDSFRQLVPGYKYWCCGNGKLYDEHEGIIKNGAFYSKEYWGNSEWYPK